MGIDVTTLRHWHKEFADKIRPLEAETFSPKQLAWKTGDCVRKMNTSNDNAQMESFGATLKTECFHHDIPKTHCEAHLMLFDYIETFYNTKRLHSSLGFKSPLDFEKQLK